MFIGFRVTRRWVVNIIVAAILARLFFMGMDGVDRFSSDWNRVTGASMPGSSGVRDVVTDMRSTLPSELDEFVTRAEADASNSRSLLDVLKSAGIEHADALLAVTSDDNVNIMTAQIAKQLYHVPHVVTRIYDPDKDAVLRQMGLNTVCPTMLTVAKIGSLLGETEEL